MTEIAPDPPDDSADAVVIGTALDVALPSVDVLLKLVAGESCGEVSPGDAEVGGCEGLGFVAGLGTKVQVSTF